MEQNNTNEVAGSDSKAMQKWTVEVDEELCSGCATCTAYAPEHFKIGETGISEFQGDVPIEDFESILEAARYCPSRAITIKNSETGETYS